MEKIQGTLLLSLTFIEASTIYGSDIDHDLDLDTKLELLTMTNVPTIDMILEID
jgi:hypothetical protein